MSSSSNLRRVALAACVALSGLGGQAPAPESLRPLRVNDEWERYARIRQVAGDAPAYPWSVRPFGLRESELVASGDSAHPWRNRETAEVHTLGTAVTWSAIDASATTIVNSSFPFGYNDGPVWSGRGLTTVLEGGFVARAGVVSAIVAPVLFRAENRPFTLRNNGQNGRLEFADGYAPTTIDQPQRYGDGAFQRLDPGNSTLRIDIGGAAIGFSTANQHWGPARDHPLVLGNNAAGFPHYFLATNRPLNLYVAKAYGRMLWGRLDSSPFSTMRAVERYRYATGLAMLVEPRGIPGLELGFSRFFHLVWTDHVLSFDNLTRPFIGLVRTRRLRASGNARGNEPDNQIASVFGRWVLPRSGFELYGEFAKDDYNYDTRDLELEPDHISGYMMGFQRVVSRKEMSYTVFRGEIVNTRLGPLAINRPQARFYVHTNAREGHTNYGQVLGSAAGFGGGATVIALDRYAERGRMSFAWSRMMRAEARPELSAVPSPQAADVFHSLSIDGIVFRSRRMATTYELTGVYEINRDLRSDAFNLRASTGVQFTW